jgi:hypothetical protein
MPKKKKLILIIGSSDLDADWLKDIDNGKRRKDDLKAHETAEKLNKEREGK